MAAVAKVESLQERRQQKGAAFQDMLKKTAAPKKPAAKKSEVPFLVVPAELKEVVDAYVEAKKRMKEAEADVEMAGGQILEYARGCQDKAGFEGRFHSSYKLQGHTEKVTFVSTNRYSINPDDRDKLSELFGEEGYAELIEEVYSVKLKDEVMTDEFLQGQLMDLVGDQFERFFETTIALKAADGFNAAVYRHVNPEHLESARVFCRQYKPSLR